jgi:hypothetical protein
MSNYLNLFAGWTQLCTSWMWKENPTPIDPGGGGIRTQSDEIAGSARKHSVPLGCDTQTRTRIKLSASLATACGGCFHPAAATIKSHAHATGARRRIILAIEPLAKFVGRWRHCTR